jgi:DUF2934 family protein
MPKHPTLNSTARGETAGSTAIATFDPDEEAISKLAYQLWKERGRPEGSPEEDWFRAQDLLRTGRAVIASSTLP